MQKIILRVFLATLFFYTVNAQEIRGTWIARNSLSSKESLAAAIDSLAKNNFNTVYINCWSRGYPLWQSQVYRSHTGMTTDPTYADRDILAETIAEAHKHGMHVEAWFEYGFVGWYAGTIAPYEKGGIFIPHPNWVARKSNGDEMDGSYFFWMAQTRKDVQNFLIALAVELCRNYDIDGIELDRIRYSSTAYGYDAYTDSLYRAENNNAAPPLNYNDTGWVRWRANKLNAFAYRIYDSIKSANPAMLVTNAPSLYSSSSYTAYNDYCQDWVSWVNNNKLDYIQLQMYVYPQSSFLNIINYALTLIQNKNKLIPAMAVKGGSFTLTNEEAQQYITAVRNKGLTGIAIWYYSDLISYFPSLKSGVFQSNIPPSHSPGDWRAYKDIITLQDTTKYTKQGLWQSSVLPGYTSTPLQAGSGNLSSIEYYFDVPAAGNYEVYAYQVTAINRTDSAQYIVYHGANDSSIVYVNQTLTSNKRWVKLGDYYLNAGRQKVFSTRNTKVKPNTFISADAAVIILNRRLSPNVSGIKNEGGLHQKKNLNEFDLKIFPNPSNNENVFSFSLPEMKPFHLAVYSSIGKLIWEYDGYNPDRFDYRMNYKQNNLASGVYFCTITQNVRQQTIKFIVMK